MTTLDARSLHLRRQIICQLAAGGQGHLGPAFSLVEILRVLFDDVLKYDPNCPNWEGRDRLILSKGHGYLALYALLADKGFFPETELDNFGHAGALLGVHPSRHIPGVEMDTGSLGHGLSLGCGMAKARPDRRVFVVMGDGECDEGAVWEAALYASKHKLSNLTAIVDCNGMQASGKTGDVQALEPLGTKWQAFGWGIAGGKHDWGDFTLDGHSINDLRKVFDPRIRQFNPRVVLCHTIKGRGIAAAENNPAWHHSSKLTDADLQALYEGLEAESCAQPA